MDRFKEIYETSESFLVNLLEKRRERVEKYYIKEQRALRYHFQKEILSLIEGKEENLKNMVIACLNSSIVTNDNAYQISLYNEDIYVDPFSPCIYYVPEFLFVDIQKDIMEIKEFLHKHFIRLMDCEIEEVRRKYMKKVYFSGKEFFIKLLPENNCQGINVWFGEYMNSVELIGGL